MAKSETYEKFVEKFKPKKTTDDCYTPPIVYNAVTDFVAQEYGLDKTHFVRPFYPGGDFENYEYNGKIVVDNPPFSILAKILDFYIENNIKFFLFAPTLTAVSTQRDRACTYVITSVKITYENGAVVNTSFVTNLDQAEIRIRTSPELYEAVKTANDENRKINTKQLPKYKYPPNVITATMIGSLSQWGIDLKIPRAKAVRISALQSQKELKKEIFGEGLLVSDKIAKRVDEAQKQVDEARKVVWKLSDEEKRIIESLNK